MALPPADQNRLYTQASAEFGPALARLARGYERNADRQMDLLQDIHFAIWRSLEGYEGRASLRTFVYRVAHNTAIHHSLKDRRRGRLAGIDELAEIPDPACAIERLEADDLLARLMALVHSLKPPDRQLMLLYLDGLDAVAIGEITGLTSGAVAVKIHRMKALLARRFKGELQP
jgi:RNA polymerase sigma-70 factor (ECF subfamily)